MCKYLTHKNLPDEVLKQPELLLNSGAAHLMRPVLNKWLRTGIGKNYKGNVDDIDVSVDRGHWTNESTLKPGTVVSIQLGADETQNVLGVVCSTRETRNNNRLNQFIGGNNRKTVIATTMCGSCGCDAISGVGAGANGKAEDGYGDSLYGGSSSSAEIGVRYFDVDLGLSSSRWRGRVRTDVVSKQILVAVEMDKLGGQAIYLKALHALMTMPPSMSFSRDGCMGTASSGLAPQRSLRPESLDMELLAHNFGNDSEGAHWNTAKSNPVGAVYSELEPLEEEAATKSTWSTSTKDRF